MKAAEGGRDPLHKIRMRSLGVSAASDAASLLRTETPRPMSDGHTSDDNDGDISVCTSSGLRVWSRRL